MPLALLPAGGKLRHGLSLREFKHHKPDTEPTLCGVNMLSRSF